MHSLLIHIPGDLDPFERGDRYETPLDRALRKAGRLGKCTGGGSGFRIDGPIKNQSFIDVDVKDRAKAAPVIAAVLKEADAPTGTLVGDHESDELLVRVTAAGPEVLVGPDHTFTPAVPRMGWQAGEVYGYRLTADRRAVLTVQFNEAKGAGVSVADWCGPELPPAADLPALIRRPATKYALTGVFHFPGQRVGGFDIRPTRPPQLAAARLTDTGVRVKPPRVKPSGAGLNEVSPRGFDRTLRRVFGLEPVAGVERMRQHLGVGLLYHYLAAWDAPGLVTPAAAWELFDAHCGKEWKPAADPLRGSVPTTDRTRRFVTELKRHFRDRADDVWDGGTFRAAEGFVAIPMAPRALPEVRAVAAALGRECGVTVYDPQADQLADGPRTRLLPPGRRP